MKVLLTGGAGFIGSHLSERLLSDGVDLTILDNFNDFYDPSIKRRNIQEVRKAGDFDLVEADLLDEAALDRVFRNHGPRVVIHLAAWAGVRPSLERPALYSQVNVTGTVNLLERAQKNRISHFIFGSSSSVYGINSKVPFSEDDPLHRPISPYAATKRAAELLCHTYHHNYGLPVTCLRFFTVYGPRQRPEMAIHKFTRLIDEGREIEVFAGGTSRRDYTYVDDIVSGVMAALERSPSFDIFNLGNSKTVLLTDLIHLIEQEIGKEARTRLLPVQPGDVPITYADITRARRELGYNPTVPIEEGVRRFVAWFKEMRE